ncbi:MAG TPA: asparagine synthase (glutamine-hydrolyzing) [Gemmatimonadaceae bacterium]
MCGLAGRFDVDWLVEAESWRDEALARLAHRGPDGAGCFRDAHCELVHRRLAIVDLTPTGHQPMPNEDETVWIVFNGEIYNHAELRSRLVRRGHVFRGTSDTEVLVHLYEEEGPDLVTALRGIFAFAIYDQRGPGLVLARDRFGVKPLFWARHHNEWIFGSEIKAITARPGFEPAIDRQACYDFLGLGYVPEPATGFANIHALPPGSVLAVTPDGVPRLSRWYRPVARPASELALADTVAQAEAGVLAAVQRQSIADVPVAALLSGGIDSSLVVAAHRQIAGDATRTFTVSFPDRTHDESATARQVAEYCGTEHVTIDGAHRPLTPDALMGLFRHFDQPFADTSFIPMYWVSSGIRDQGIKCALSGDGGDETFGGYARFWRLPHVVRLMESGAVMLRAAVAGGRLLAPATRDLGRQLARAAALARAGLTDSAPLLSGFASYLDEDEKAALVRREAREGLLPDARLFDGYEPPAVRDVEELSRRMTETLFAVSLPSDMLRKVDMMSMKAGLEVRVPLLDEDVVGLGFTLPHRLKAQGRTAKLVLRALARQWLPTPVAQAPKHGFTIPLDVMVPAELHVVLADLLTGADARTRPFLDARIVRRWLHGFAAASRGGARDGRISREGRYRRALMLLSLELWMRDHHLTW